MTLLLAVAAGALIGLSLGALGGGGSILAVPVLAHRVQPAGMIREGQRKRSQSVIRQILNEVVPPL